MCSIFIGSLFLFIYYLNKLIKDKRILVQNIDHHIIRGHELINNATRAIKRAVGPKRQLGVNRSFSVDSLDHN